MTPRNALAAIVLLLASATPGTVRGVHGAPRLAPCTVGGQEVLCGTLRVPENRSMREARKIPIGFVVAPARGPSTARDPVFVLAGGPGQAATEQIDFFLRLFAPLRDERDLVFVDLRGTGRSNPLRIMVPPGRLLEDLEFLYPPSWVDSTRQRLSRSTDVTQYTTVQAMADLDDVREHLGYREINLYGTSYGSRCALEYLRRHDERVRAVVLKSVAPPELPVGLYYARDHQRSLDLLFQDCASNDTCLTAYPDLRERLARVLARLDSVPEIVRVTDPETGDSTEIRITRDAWAAGLRMLLYSPSTRAITPLLIHEAEQGDFSSWTRWLVRIRTLYAREIYGGAALSVLAAEDLPRLTDDAIARWSGGTFLGQAFARNLRSVCERWPRVEPPPDYGEPVTSGVPALLLSGRLDPATPPQWGERAASTMSNATHIVFPYGSHSADGMLPETARLIDAFIRHPGRPLDATFLETMPVPHFAAPSP